MAEHKDLPNSKLHEPLHIKTLTAGATDRGKVIVAKGDGTSEPRKLSLTDLQENIAIVYVSEEADFPAPSGGVIDLGSGVTYILTQPVEVTSRFLYGASVKLDGINPGAVTLTYNGVLPLFSNNGTADIRTDNLVVNCPNSKLFELADAVSSGNIRCESSDFFCAEIGGFNNTEIIQFNQCDLVPSTNGMVFTGLDTNPVFNQTNCQNIVGGGVFLDITAVEMRGGRITFSAIVETASGVVGIRSNGANDVVAGSRFILRDVETQLTAPLSGGVVSGAARWTFENVIGIKDSQVGLDTSLDTLTTVSISGVNQYEPIAGGNWTTNLVADVLNTDANGLTTFTGEQDVTVQIIATATVEKVGGGNDIITAAIAKNGVIIDASKGATNSADPDQVTCLAVFDLTFGDTIQLYVANEDSTSNVRVSRAAINGIRVP